MFSVVVLGGFFFLFACTLHILTVARKKRNWRESTFKSLVSWLLVARLLLKSALVWFQSFCLCPHGSQQDVTVSFMIVSLEDDSLSQWTRNDCFDLMSQCYLPSYTINLSRNFMSNYVLELKLSYVSRLNLEPEVLLLTIRSLALWYKNESLVSLGTAQSFAWASPQLWKDTRRLRVKRPVNLAVLHIKMKVV